MYSYTEKDFLQFAKLLSQKVYSFTNNYYREKLITGNTKIEYKNELEIDTKGEHKIDEYVKQLILEEIYINNSEVFKYINVFMEEFESFNKNDSICSIFIDPVDGSRSMDQHIGDPCIMFGFTDKLDISSMKFGDLKSCYIKGLHSGDVYFTLADKAYYVPGGFNFEVETENILIYAERDKERIKISPIKLSNAIPKALKDSCVIIRDGYGMRDVVEQKIDHSILNMVKHTFSHDITGMELCYLASGRDIVHLLVEARTNISNGKWRGSDGFNLIPYPFVKAVGGEVYTLAGQAIGSIHFDPHKMYDFIAAANIDLKNEFVEKAVRK